MDHREIHEAQYSQGKLVHVPRCKFFGLRKLLASYDIDRYAVVHAIAESGKRVLDIGCGNGSLLLLLKDKFKELHGIDMVQSRLSAADELLHESIRKEGQLFEFHQADVGEGIPFKDDFFDTVTMVSTVEHIYDVFFLMREVHRVLRRRGHIIVQVPNLAYVQQRVTLLFGSLPVTSSPYSWETIGWDGGHIHFFTMKKLCWLLETEGFKVLTKKGSGFLAPLRAWWPSLLCGDLIVKAEKVDRDGATPG
jgi:methionine biosynthesis protein MetW